MTFSAAVPRNTTEWSEGRLSSGTGGPHPTILSESAMSMKVCSHINEDLFYFRFPFWQKPVHLHSLSTSGHPHLAELFFDLSVQSAHGKPPATPVRGKFKFVLGAKSVSHMDCNSWSWFHHGEYSYINQQGCFHQKEIW